MQTVELKNICEVFSNVIKNNSIRPITDLVQIMGREMIMTDGITTICANLSEEIKGKCVISLSKLFSITKLTTTDEIELKIHKDYVSFKGNGNYKIPINVDSGGEEINLSTNISFNFSSAQKFSIDKIKEIYGRSKIAISDINEELSAFYFINNGMVATDSVIVAFNKCDNFIVDNIQPHVLEKLSYLKTDVEMGLEDNKILVKSDIFTLSIINDKANFPIDSVKPFISPLDSQTLFCNSFKIQKKDLLMPIKRQNVFKSIFNPPSVYIDILSNKVHITNKNKTSDEELLYSELTNDDAAVHVIVSTERLMGILKVMDEEIKIYLGCEAMALEDSKGFYILGCMEEK